MAKKKRKGRTSKSGPKSSINADEHPVDIAFKLEQGKREWITPLNAALRKYEANFGSLPDKFLSEITPEYYLAKIGTPILPNKSYRAQPQGKTRANPRARVRACAILCKLLWAFRYFVFVIANAGRNGARSLFVFIEMLVA